MHSLLRYHCLFTQGTVGPEGPKGDRGLPGDAGSDVSELISMSVVMSLCRYVGCPRLTRKSRKAWPTRTGWRKGEEIHSSLQ